MKMQEIFQYIMDKVLSSTKSLLCFAAEDIKLNSTVFHWPDHIKTVFELSTSRIANRRDHIEEDLRKRTQAFEEKLNDYMKEVESFKKKEVGLNLTTLCFYGK